MRGGYVMGTVHEHVEHECEREYDIEALYCSV